MKIYNQEKTELIDNPDLEKGYLINDKITTLIPEQKEVKQISHYEPIRIYYRDGTQSSGEDYDPSKPVKGREMKEVIDVEGVPYIPEHEEYEEIQIYIPYTEEQLKVLKQQNYENSIVMKIRAKYSLDQELAILRQRDTKPEEFAEYNDYVEECKALVKEEFGEV